jgi:hypothetical protein
MSRPLRSTPITGASPLLRAGPPARAATVLTTSGFSRSVCSLSPTTHHGVVDSVDTRLPHVPHSSRRPDSRHLHAGHRLANNSGTRQTHPGIALRPRFRCHFLNLDASAVVHSRSSSRSPPDDSHAAFSSTLTTTVFSQRSSRWFDAIPRKDDAEGPHNLHLLCSKHFQTVASYMTAPSMRRGATIPFT